MKLERHLPSEDVIDDARNVDDLHLQKWIGRMEMALVRSMQDYLVAFRYILISLLTKSPSI